jgi:UDP-3-O-[3-hydroxymyristoyl] glucosamine N-acyltransferase
MTFTVADVAKLVGGTVHGNAKLVINGVNSLGEAKPGEISFLANQAYVGKLHQTRATAVIVPAVQDDCPLAQVVVPDADLAFALVVSHYGPQPRPMPAGIQPSAVIGDDVQLGENVHIGAGAIIGDGATIGDNTIVHPLVAIGPDVCIGKQCIIYPQVTIRERCRIDDSVIVHAGAVIGADGFGYASLEGVHHKIPQVGIVHIESDVEIGANTTIDRARFGVTRIGRGTKIDNLVQIAHNCDIGEHCIVVAQVGIAGSTTMGRHVTVAGQSGITGHLSIGDGAILAARSGIAKNVPAGAVVMGAPACDMKLHKEREVSMRRLPRTIQTVKQLEARLADLEAKLAKFEKHS